MASFVGLSLPPALWRATGNTHGPDEAMMLFHFMGMVLVTGLIVALRVLRPRCFARPVSLLLAIGAGLAGMAMGIPLAIGIAGW